MSNKMFKNPMRASSSTGNVNITFTDILKTIFLKLDLNEDGFITNEDLTNFKSKRN